MSGKILKHSTHSVGSYFAISGAALTLLLVLTGPSYAQGLSLFEALVFHAVTIFAPLGMAVALASWALARISGQVFKVWTVLALCGATAALLSSPFLLLAEMVFEPLDVDGDQPPSPQNIVEFAWLSLQEAVEALPAVTAVWLALNVAVNWMLDERAEEPERRGETSAPVFKYVPARLGRDVVSLVAEQHYTVVRTTTGSACFLYALRDAISELEQAGYQGIQCHRSAWVCLDHAKSIRHDGQKSWVELTDGSRVPISRRRRVAVKQALA
ncbi:MAG: LytTR family DNA-binding domain-containing protein [Pseudomonadota bacterium]